MRYIIQLSLKEFIIIKKAPKILRNLQILLLIDIVLLNAKRNRLGAED